MIKEEPSFSSRFPSIKGREVSPSQRRELASLRAGEAADSDSDGARPSTKRGGSALPTQVVRGGMGVKQPLKRGGRRL
jgi:hypothetical protein